MKKHDSEIIRKKREKEQLVVSEMIALYCRKKHGARYKGELCPDCRELCTYACARSKHCPFMDEKTFCVNCRVHCYKTDMRESIREVMRFSGPRMIFYHPGMALWHLICSKREKYRIIKQQERGTKDD
ncbi:MAG: nitrous oxide-stimulated promoter family protein [Wujia sp.]